MSRMFSSTVRAAKALKWELNGTTEPVDWAKRIMERVVDQVPKLAEIADRAVINGNPHPTGEDPYHVSGVRGTKNLKGKNRLMSFHIYPDGTVTFSNEKLPTVKDSMEGAETSTDATERGRPEASSSQQSLGWEWDAENNTNKYWDTDLNMLVFWDTAESRSKYWDGTKWVCK